MSTVAGLDNLTMSESNTDQLKDVVTIRLMIAEFQIFNTEGLFSIVRILFH